MPIEDDLPIFGTNIDESQVPPIHQKRIVAFVNTFLIKTAEFLDQFASLCEERFVEVEGKLNRMEAVLSLLETKLDSVPDLKNFNAQSLSAKETIEVQKTEVTATQSPVVAEETDGKSPQEQTETVSSLTSQQIEEKPPETEVSTEGGVKAKDDYRYKKYYKMVHYGVPPSAIKQKMQAEGVDPNLLDTPDLILADGILEPPMQEGDSSEEESN